MKTTKYFLLVLGAFLFIGKTTHAQNSSPDYQSAIGIKFGGYENSLTYKYFKGSANSIEGVLGLRSHGVILTGLFELNQTAFNTSGFKFYYGPGAHLGIVGAGDYKKINGDSETYDGTSILIGLDGTIGLEYVIGKSPIAVSLDLNPRLEFTGGVYFDIAPGLGVKYCFR